MIDFDGEETPLDKLIEDVKDDVRKARGQERKAHLNSVLRNLLELKLLRLRFNVVLDNYTCLLNAIKVKML